MFLVSDFPYHIDHEHRSYDYLNKLPLDPVEGDVVGEDICDNDLIQTPTRSKPVLSIEGGRWIGEASEGIVIEVRVQIATAVGPQTLTLAEKIFKHPKYTEWRYYDPSYPRGNPELQWQNAQEIRRINRERQLGIKMPPTFLLRRFADKRARTLSTLLPVARDFLKEQRVDFDADRIDQRKRVNLAGFLAPDDAFFPVWDSTLKKLVAVLGDYGGVVKF